MYDRGRRLAEEASQLGVRLLIDAEQVRYQPSIDNLVLELQRQYNGEKPIVYNTYQCYLRDAPERLRTDVAPAGKEPNWPSMGGELQFQLAVVIQLCAHGARISIAYVLNIN